MTKRITLTESNDQTPLREPIVERSTTPTFTATELLHLLLRKRRRIVAITCVVTLLAAAILFMLPNQYQSDAKLLPSGAQDKMADLKRLAGFGSMSASDENSSELFPEILRSRTIQDSVLAKRYNFTHNAKPYTLKLDQYFDRENPDKLRGKLNDITYVGLDKKTGVIDISVETEYPELSREILATYLAQLESFNLYTRRSAARENAIYLGRQIDQNRIEMAAAEDSLESYQASNRNWLEGSSPDLLKTIARLQREVEIQNKKYLYLTQEFEIAKLDAQKDVPIMRVLDEPSLPVEKTGPKRALLLVTILLMTGLTSCFGMAAAELWRKRVTNRQDPELGRLSEEFNSAFPTVSRVLLRVEKSAETEEVKV